MDLLEHKRQNHIANSCKNPNENSTSCYHLWRMLNYSQNINNFPNLLNEKIHKFSEILQKKLELNQMQFINNWEFKKIRLNSRLSRAVFEQSNRFINKQSTGGPGIRMWQSCLHFSYPQTRRFNKFNWFLDLEIKPVSFLYGYQDNAFVYPLINHF